MRKRAAAVCAVLIVVACFAEALSSAAVRTSQSGWTWGNPRPQGHTLRAVEFAGGDGYAVGDFGTVLRTDDGGATWSGVRTGSTTVSLSKLRVLDANTFLAGGGCTLLRSDDAGQHVRPLRFTATAGCSAPLASLSFPTSDDGYLLRDDRSVLRTTDGGQTFTARSAIPGGAPGPMNDIWFTSPDNGVVVTGADVAGQILHTDDGGTSWDNVKATRAVRSVYFVSALTGYAVGDGVALKTTDGGATWSDLPDPGGSFRSVRCADEMHCVMVSVANTVFYTSDGFATVQHSTRADGDAESTVPALAAAFSSVTRAVAVGDDGDTWTSDSDGAAFDRGYISPLKTLSRIRVTSKTVAHAAGTEGQVARTTDGGASWDPVGVPTTNRIVDVAFPNASTGYAVDTAGAFFSTANGGGSWAILGQTAPPTTNGLCAQDTLILTSSSSLLRSSDGGASFSKVPGKAGSRAYGGLACAGAHTALGFGPKTLALTGDGGKSWKLLKLPKNKKKKVVLVPRSASVASGGRVRVLGSDGRLWASDDAGKHWRELVALGTAGGYDVSFANDKQGYVAVSGFAGRGGGQGWILHTSDGGASWRPQLLDNRPVHDVAAASGANAFALTGNDHLFHTATGGDAASPSKLSLKAIPQFNHRVRVKGKLSPAVAGGARVAVLYRVGKSSKWQRRLLKAAGNGRFAVTVKDAKSDPKIVFVAQWTGNQALGSAGSRAVSARPLKPPKAKPGPIIPAAR